jgi:hypothetical protein
MNIKTYNVLTANQSPEMYGLWDGAAWHNVPALEVDNFRPESSAHRPQTLCKLLYDQETLYGIFRVDDQYVRCVNTGFQADVYKDSCVELFLKPKTTGGYFNFEFNCGGALLASYVTDPTRIEGRVKECTPLAPEDDCQIRRYSNLPVVVEPEITHSQIWFLEFSIPFAVLAKYAGPLREMCGQSWRGNFYKCGNETSHPHWGAWSPVHDLNFHLPECFGNIQFEGSVPRKKPSRYCH